MRLTNVQAGTFCAGYVKLEDVVLDNDRGMAAANLYAIVLGKAQAYQLRQKALQKERAKLVEDHAKKDRKGNKEYANPNEPDPTKRILVWHNPDAWQKAIEAWSDKAEALDAQILEFEATPLPDDFFTKPDELKVVNAIRTAFLPVMKSAQAALTEKAHPQGTSKRRRR